MSTVDYNHHECDGHCADIITSPGKFEGEPAYVRDLLWPIMLDGCSDATTGQEDQTVDWIREPFYCDALRDVAGFAIWEDSVGFARIQRFDTREQFDLQLAESMSADSADDTPTEPDNDDIICRPSGRLGALTLVTQSGKTIIESNDSDKIDQAIRDWMDQHQFWPTVWDVSDHGNTSIRPIAYP